MVFILLAISAVLSYYLVLVPVHRYQAKMARIRATLTYRDFQVAWIKKHYPELEGYTFDEIREHFDVDAAYERIRV